VSGTGSQQPPHAATGPPRVTANVGVRHTARVQCTGPARPSRCAKTAGAMAPPRGNTNTPGGTLAIDRNPRLSCGDGQTSTHPTPDGRETLWARG